MDVSINAVDSLDAALEFKRWLGQRRPVLGIDTETGGLEWWRVRLRTVQFGDANGAWVLPWEDWAGLAKEALTSYEGQLVMHNAKFDRHMLQQAGGLDFPWWTVDDTLLMAHVLKSNQLVGLKALAKRLVDPHADAADMALDTAMQKQGWTYDTVPADFPTYIIYAALDSIYTARLWEQFQPEVQRRGLWAVYQLDLCVSELLQRMEARGCSIDVPHVDAHYTQYMETVDEWTALVKKNWHVSPTSNKKLVDALQAEGIELTKLTPGGSISVDGDVLRQIDHPLAQYALRTRQVSKITSTYLKNFLELHDHGILRPSTKPLGARTGRMSMSMPNLQNLPRDHEGRPEALAVRDSFIPREDHVLIMADFDQIEQRIMAHYAWQVAGDPGMVQAFQQGGDFFTNMAHRIYDDTSIVKSDPRRQMTKNASYAKGYGAGVEKFSLTAGVPFSVGQAFIDRYDATYPGVRGFQRYVDRVATERQNVEGEAYVYAVTGRVHLSDDNKHYTLVNYKIQGEACDILKQKMIALDVAGLGEYMILPVHDEVIFDVPRELARDVVATCKNVMPERELYAVPLTVGVDVVTRWGRKYVGETLDV